MLIFECLIFRFNGYINVCIYRWRLFDLINWVQKVMQLCIIIFSPFHWLENFAKMVNFFWIASSKRLQNKWIFFTREWLNIYFESFFMNRRKVFLLFLTFSLFWSFNSSSLSFFSFLGFADPSNCTFRDSIEELTLKDHKSSYLI